MNDVIDNLLLLEVDHDPDGWPAVQMREISEVCERAKKAEAERAELQQQLLAEHQECVDALSKIDELEAERDELEARVNDLEEIMRLIDYNGIRAEHFKNSPRVSREDAEVKVLCERYGFGAVMDSAARQWFLRDRDGAFTCGPCCLTVRQVMEGE